MKKIYFLLAMAFIHGTVFSQTTITLTPESDNTIYQDFPTNSNGKGAQFFAGTNVSGGFRRGLVRFDIASNLPANAVISSVSLSMYCNRAPLSTSFDVKLHTLLQGFGEGASDAGSFSDGDGVTAMANDATWPCSNADGFGGCITSWTGGGVFTATASATTPVGAAFTNYLWSGAGLVTDVQNWLNNPAANFGWAVIGEESGTRTVKRFGSRENSPANQPQLTITYNIVVPVQLTYFNGRETKQGNELNWETAQEVNNDYFLLQHSTDGSAFKTITKIKGAGNSALLHKYRFIHSEAAPGRNFYRLVQTDFDGRMVYAPVVLLSTKASAGQIAISPNPVKDRIYTGNTQPGTVFYILDYSGRKLLSGALSQPSIDVSGLVAGQQYLLCLQLASGKVITGKFMKGD
ncbi:MAG: hypothetical protein JWQ27_1526 [Ferruginibacter sp.]|nr:hypothetical protein [Ferruginibacter sp.]